MTDDIECIESIQTVVQSDKKYFFAVQRNKRSLTN